MPLSLLVPKTVALLQLHTPEILSAMDTSAQFPCFSTADKEVCLKHSFIHGITLLSVQTGQTTTRQKSKQLCSARIPKPIACYKAAHSVS